MKKLFIVANWKSNKTTEETTAWLQELQSKQQELPEKEVIVCAPFTLLPTMNSFISKHKLQIKLGAQDVSPFDEGAYTGAVNAKQVKEFAEYVLIGHSERKRLFHEDEDMVVKKVKQARLADLIPIVFLQDTASPVPAGVEIVVYEPPSAISTISHGKPETPEDVAAASKKIHEQHNDVAILYGGSVNEENVRGFTSLPLISGVVPGKASLAVESFYQIIEKA